MNPPILETARLTIRELNLDDLDFLADMLGHPEVNRYYEKQFTRRDAEEWIERQLMRYERDGHGFWLLALKEGNEPVGQAGLVMQEVDGRRRPEIGWMLDRPCWGNGYATEAATAIRDTALKSYDLKDIMSLIRPENEPSQRVAERIGMEAGDHVNFHGLDHIVYGLKESETHRL